MTRRLTDEQIESVLAGRPLADAPELAEFVARLTAFADLDVDPDTAAAQITAAAAAAAGTQDVAAAPHKGRMARMRRRLAFSGVLSSLAAKLILGTSVALAATAGAAAAGVLPDPIQSVAADAASIVGIHIPDPDDALTVTPRGPDSPSPTAAEPEATTTTTAETTTTTTSVPTTTTTSPEDTEGESSGQGSSDEDAETQAPLATLTGDHSWLGVACDGSALTVEYSIGEDGTVTAGTSTPAATVSTTRHGFDASFADATVSIDLTEHGDEWRLRERVKRSCDQPDDEGGDHDDDDDDSDTTTTTTEADDDHDSGTTTTTEADDHDDDDDDDDSDTTTTTEADDDHSGHGGGGD